MNNNEEILDSKIDDLYMVFVINNQKYALSSKYITEIIEILPITKVPFLPEYMKGIINLRSTIIPVMDARMRFGMEPIEYSERTCIIIIENEANKKKNGNAGAASGSAEEDEDFTDDGDSDEALIREAADLAFEYNQISTSFLQRKLRLGYSRASRIVDSLEERGLISAADGSKPRKVILSREAWESSLNT